MKKCGNSRTLVDVAVLLLASVCQARRETIFLFKWPTRRTNYPNLFCYKTLHVSGILFAHHQEFSTVHSALIGFMQVFDDRFQAESGCSIRFQAESGCSILTLLGSDHQKHAWNLPVLNVQWKTDDGQRGCPKYVEFYNRINLYN